MIHLLRTNSENPDFVTLVALLDADLARRDGSDHAYYSQFNKLDAIRHAVVAYHDGAAVACGAMKEFAPGVMEIKRMWTIPEHRGRGLASGVVAELERWAVELHYVKCVLETGKRQPEAVALYKKCGYRIIENYGQYAGVENSVCFEKSLGVQETGNAGD